MSEALFDLIHRQGNPELPVSEKFDVVFSPQELLKELGTKNALVDEIGDVASRLLPLNTLILARKPKNSERNWFEGRGAYHTDIPITKDVSVTVYVKGTGNEKSFDQPSGGFTGFPSQPDKLFFDDLMLSDHPRELGTETVRWALLEAVNASFIFAHVAKKQNWSHIAEAINAGVTIPLNIMHQKELSAYLFKLLQEQKNVNQDETNKEALEWEGNTQLGTISLIVPNHKRIAGGIGNAEKRSDVVERISNPNVAKTAGRTLRTLADMGFCYSMESSHGQNLYSNGLMAQADNSDLVTLGDYQGANIHWSNDERGNPIYYTVTPQDQRIALLFNQFERPGLLTPIHLPLMNPTNRITWEQVVDSQTAFWKEMLSGIAEPIAIQQMVHYMPFMRTEINMAASLLLTDSLNQNQWETMARKKREILTRYENDYGVMTEYNNKIKANLSDESEPYLIKQLMEQGKLHAELVASCLKSGDLTSLERDPILGKAVILEKAIEEMTDIEKRDEILELSSMCFSSRGRVYSFLQEADLAARFAGQHYDLLTQLIKDGKYMDAIYILKTLIMSQNNEIASYYPLHGGYEIEKDRYPRLVLEKNAKYEEIYNQTNYDLWLSSLARETHPFNFVSAFREAVNKGTIAPQPLSLLEYSKTHQLPAPASIVRDILGSYEEISDARQEITDWIEKYYSKFWEQEDLEDRFGDQGMAILSELDMMVENIQDTYPELAFAHQSIFAPALADSHPKLAQKYFDLAKHYYDTSLKDRKKLSNVDLEKSNDLKEDKSEYSHAVIAIAYQFKTLGFPIIAKDYQNKSREEYFAASW